MNKTLMLVICDFLLLSMLALARFDPVEAVPQPTPDATAAASEEADLRALLEESLEAEFASRENLSEDLATTRESLQEQARLLAEREAALEATRRNLEQAGAEAEELSRSRAEIEADRTRLAEEKARVEAERERVAQRFETTRTELEAATRSRAELERSLGQLREESSVSRERLSQSAEELQAREIALAQREAALEEAREEARRLAQEREQLNQLLGVAHAERAMLEQNLTREQQAKLELQREKQEAVALAGRLTDNVSQLGLGVSQLGEGVSQLGQGVTTLERQSQEIRREMEESRPRTMSEIFTQFQNNRATIRFTAEERTLFGNTATRTYETRSILISDEEATYLVTHTANTPFSFSKHQSTVLGVQLQIDLNGRSFPVNQIGFLSADPRIIFIPLPRHHVEASGLETFRLSQEPGRWEEAVLIKNDESNFGRTGFRRLTASDRFLRMDRPALGELFSDFASSRGDLAFTKNSRFVGLLTDRQHAVVIDAFLASAITNLGTAFDADKNVETIDRLKDRVRKLPREVQ